MEDKIKARITELTKMKEDAVANLNAILGAISELTNLIKKNENTPETN